MNSRSTITVTLETKQALEALRKSRSWDEFLMSLVAEVQEARRRQHKKRLSELLDMGYGETRVKEWAREY